MSAPTLGIARAVIGGDENFLRFEEYCADVVALLEGGATVVTTSRNYDQGRDAISIGQGPFVAACCSLTTAIDDKFLSDFKKLTRKTRGLRNVYVCTSQPLTEYGEDKLSGELRAKSKTSYAESVVVLSLDKLAKIGRQNPKVLSQHYRSEVADGIARLRDDGSGSAESTAMRLALLTTGSRDAARIRRTVWTGAVRDALNKQPGSTPEGIALAISNTLQTAGTISPGIVVQYLRWMEQSDQVEERDGRYTLTVKGRAGLLSDDERVTSSLLEGKRALVQAVEEKLGHTLVKSQHDRMWTAVQDQLAHLFYTRGQELLALLVPVIQAHGEVTAAIPEPAPAASDPKFLHTDISEPIARAAASIFTSEQQQNEVHIAVRDTLRFESKPVVTWLANTCYAFICACALGLESGVRETVETLIRNSSLTFDTDVVLSLVCEAESNHGAVANLWRRWRELGGRTLASDAVLVEAAYHAWIARTDFYNVRDIVPLFNDIERHLLSRNAFVRSFSLLLKRKRANLRHWDQWIKQYRGSDPRDTKRIESTLRRGYGFGSLPGAAGRYRRLVTDVRAYLENKLQKDPKYKQAVGWDDYDDFVRRDKANRDAELFGALMQSIERASEMSDGRATYLVTSSSRFADVMARFSPQHRNFVLSVPAATYMLALCPGRALGLTALRSFLFDYVDRNWRPNDFELMALRVAKRSPDYDMPWAKREQVLDAVREQVEEIAREETRSPRKQRQRSREIKDELSQTSDTAPAKAEVLATMVTKAMERVGVDHRLERENEALRQRIADLERQMRERK